MENKQNSTNVANNINDYFALAKTPAEGDLLMDELNQVYESLYRSDPLALEKILKEKIRLEVAELLKRDLKGDRGGFLKSLIQTLKKRKSLKLSVGIIPNESLIEDLFNWARQNISEDILIDINTSKDVIGGAVISYNGKYFDYSLRKFLITQN